MWWRNNGVDLNVSSHAQTTAHETKTSMVDNKIDELVHHFAALEVDDRQSTQAFAKNVIVRRQIDSGMQRAGSDCEY